MKLSKLIIQKNKPNIATVLGNIVIFCSFFYKIPQIIKINNAKSAKGVNLLSNLQDLIAYIFAFSYSYSQKHQFSTYGENLFQGLSTLIICSQIYYYERKLTLRQISNFIFGVGSSVIIMCKSKEIFGKKIGTYILNLSKTITILFGLTGKIPQIMTNYKSQAVGQLSLTTTFSNFIGSTARIYTILKQLVEDKLMITAQTNSLLLNGILVLQILYYGPNGRIKKN
jgi:mannose-P-dolichol utilization defect 1